MKVRVPSKISDTVTKNRTLLLSFEKESNQRKLSHMGFIRTFSFIVLLKKKATASHIRTKKSVLRF